MLGERDNASQGLEERNANLSKYRGRELVRSRNEQVCLETIPRLSGHSFSLKVIHNFLE